MEVSVPSYNNSVADFKPRARSIADWKTFRKGLNLLLRPTELGRDEMSQADNVFLTGSGVPTGRWGTNTYFQAGASGSGRIRGLGTYIEGATNDIFALTDAGYLEKKNGTASTRIAGQSWPSGSIIRTEQLGGSTYIVSEDVAFTSYAGTDLSVFVTISPPTGLYATGISGVTGTTKVCYKVLANALNGGHTQPSAEYVVNNLPADLTTTLIKVMWSAPSGASVSSYEIHKGFVQGDERFYTAVDGTVTTYFDTSASEPSPTVLPPLTNTTGGIKAPFIKKFQNRLLLAHGSKLDISGLYPDHTSFSLMDGGGSIEIEPDSGDDITGIEVQPIANRIVVYKEHSSYLVQLEFITVGSFYLMNPSYTPISTSVGCSSQDTIATVENDTFYFGRDGLYVTGYEPNFLNIIRTNETSARIRPYLAKLSAEDFATCCAMYANHKYILSFPRLREMVVYDRERGCFAGIWKLPYGIRFMKKYFDGSGTERWVIGSDEDNKVYEFIPSVNNDTSTAIIKTVRTNKDSFGDWTRLASLEFFYILMRAITGSVTVNIIIEDKNGTTSNAKTFTITGSEVAGLSGWGTDMWGSAPWGDTNTDEFSASQEEITRWGTIFKQIRSVQVEVTSSSTDSNFELLSINMKAKPLTTGGSLSSSQRV